MPSDTENNDVGWDSHEGAAWKPRACYQHVNTSVRRIDPPLVT